MFSKWQPSAFQLVLLAVLRLGQEEGSAARERPSRSSWSSRRRDGSRAGRSTTLDRLEGKGLLRWKIATGGPERGALPRRAYVVTARGMAAVRGAQRTLQRMWRGLEQVLKDRS
jgi:hypothetical protein